MNATTIPRQSSRLCACSGSIRPAADQHVVEHAVLGEERAHHLRGDDERDEQRPAVEPAQDRQRARVLAQRQVAGDRDRDDADPERRDQDDRGREPQVGRVELERLREVLGREAAVLAAEGEDGGHDERRDEERRDDREGRRREREADPAALHAATSIPRARSPRGCR
jgi:hypothetical protein